MGHNNVKNLGVSGDPSSKHHQNKVKGRARRDERRPQRVGSRRHRLPRLRSGDFSDQLTSADPWLIDVGDGQSALLLSLTNHFSLQVRCYSLHFRGASLRPDFGHLLPSQHGRRKED
jgi:hypothetical protein